MIGFTNLTEFELSPGVNFGNVFFYSWFSLLILAVVMLYLWPLLISPRDDRPLRWYYPLVCGCLRKPTAVEDDGEIDRKDTTVLEDQEDLEAKLLSRNQDNQIDHQSADLGKIIERHPHLTQDECKLIS